MILKRAQAISTRATSAPSSARTLCAQKNDSYPSSPLPAIWGRYGNHWSVYAMITKTFRNRFRT